MKHLFLLAFTIFSFSFSTAQTVNKEVIDNKGKPKLLGLINKDGLTSKTYAQWFNKNHDAYLVNDKITNKLNDSINNYKIKVFLGTWCGDSKREVPRFYKTIEATNFNMKNLEVIALDVTKDAYKQGPNGEQEGLNIHRVPTFIFYKNEKEVNRIVEQPQETIERDILKITTGKKYKPNYSAANYLGNLLNETSLDSLSKKTTELRDFLSNRVKHSGELNTLGYVLSSAKHFEKALFAFKINKAIFPYNVNVLDSYAEGLYNNKEYTKALKNYYKVLSIKPEDENALQMIERIKKNIIK